MKLEARGHLIDQGLLARALDTVSNSGARYRVLQVDIGRTPDEQSHVVIELQEPKAARRESLLDSLGALGFSPPEEIDAKHVAVRRAGVAPEGFYSTTNQATRVRVDGRWRNVRKQRMDAVIVIGPRDAQCVKLRDLVRGQRVVVGHEGVQVVMPPREAEADGFSFMSNDISSERRVEAQAGFLADLWKRTRAEGGKVVLVCGPVVIHTGQAGSLAKLIDRGWVDALLAGNALAVHDVEATVLGTSLGVSQSTGQPVMHGHMNHMRAINLVREAGSLGAAVRKGTLKSGVMHALESRGVPYCLAGSIRDDGPLPDTEMDLIAAQETYAKLLKGAGLVIVLGSMLHGIGVGNMLPASVTLVAVDINPAMVAKLGDRGSSHTVPIVTDAGLFVAELARLLNRRAPARKRKS